MKIWGRANSINVQKVLWAAEECGLKYERTDVGGAFGEQAFGHVGCGAFKLCIGQQDKPRSEGGAIRLIGQPDLRRNGCRDQPGDGDGRKGSCNHSGSSRREQAEPV